jgi:hypothetical protein
MCVKGKSSNCEIFLPLVLQIRNHSMVLLSDHSGIAFTQLLAPVFSGMERIRKLPTVFSTLINLRVVDLSGHALDGFEARLLTSRHAS